MKFKEVGGFSPRYAAPEVFANIQLMVMADPEIDKKSDVYSFSVIMWEMLTRQVPWDGVKRDEIERNVRRGARVRGVDLPFFLQVLWPLTLFLSLSLPLSPPPALSDSQPFHQMTILIRPGRLSWTSSVSAGRRIRQRARHLPVSSAKSRHCFERAGVCVCVYSCEQRTCNKNTVKTGASERLIGSFSEERR